MLKNVHPQVADSGFDSFRQTAAACESYLIERLLFSRIADSDTLDIGLRWGPEKPDITLSFQNVHHFSASGLPDVSAGPLDQITTTVLEPGDEPWPDGLEPGFHRSAELPPLLWFHVSGPVRISVLSSTAAAYIEARPSI